MPLNLSLHIPLVFVYIFLILAKYSVFQKSVLNLLIVQIIPLSRIIRSQFLSIFLYFTLKCLYLLLYFYLFIRYLFAIFRFSYYIHFTHFQILFLTNTYIYLYFTRYRLCVKNFIHMFLTMQLNNLIVFWVKHLKIQQQKRVCQICIERMLFLYESNLFKLFQILSFC